MLSHTAEIKKLVIGLYDQITPKISALTAVEPVGAPLATFETYQVKYFSNKRIHFTFKGEIIAMPI